MCAGEKRPAVVCAKTDNKRATLQVFTGATGFEPATSGVTGRVGHNDAQRPRFMGTSMKIIDRRYGHLVRRYLRGCAETAALTTLRRSRPFVTCAN
jgi:hypothetical protein